MPTSATMKGARAEGITYPSDEIPGKLSRRRNRIRAKIEQPAVNISVSGLLWMTASPSVAETIPAGNIVQLITTAGNCQRRREKTGRDHVCWRGPFCDRLFRRRIADSVALLLPDSTDLDKSREALSAGVASFALSIYHSPNLHRCVRSVIAAQAPPRVRHIRAATHMLRTLPTEAISGDNLLSFEEKSTISARRLCCGAAGWISGDGRQDGSGPGKAITKKPYEVDAENRPYRYKVEQDSLE